MKTRLLMIVCVATLLVPALVAVAQDETPRFEIPPHDIMAKVMDVEKFPPLFEPDLINAVYEEGGWAFEEGELVAKGKGDIWTRARYGNFALSLEFKCVADTNSGVFIRCGDLEDWLHTAIEVQILQNNQDYKNEKHHCGAIFDCLEPIEQLVKEPGEWNHYVIVARDNHIWVFLNNAMANYIDLDKWTEPRRNPDGTRNKFKNAYKDMPREGHIGLQWHGQDIRFRNLRVEKID